MIVKTYTISKELNLEQLDSELVASVSVTDYNGCNYYGNTLEVNGSSMDEAILDTVIDNHVAAAPSPFKLTGNFVDPTFIDYDLYGLQKKRTITKGELLLVEYYRTFDPSTNTYDDLILSEQRIYTRDEATGIVKHRVQLNKWYREDGTVGKESANTKYYSFLEAVDEGMARRKNVIGEAKGYAIMNLGLAGAQALLSMFIQEIGIYIDGSTGELITAIQASDVSIKAGLVSILTL